MSDQTFIRPAFVRIPKSGERCPLTGLTRGVMNNLTLPCSANRYTPPVRSRILRQPGKNRGVKLVEVDSLLEYLNSLPVGGEE